METSIVNAPNAYQFLLSNVLQSISSLICITYLSLALGCGIVAFISTFAGRFSKNSNKEEFAAKVIQIGAGNLGVSFLFGIVPIFTIYLSYSQFLFNLETPVTEYFLLAAILNFIGLLLLNQFRAAFSVKKFVHEGAEAQEVLEHANTMIQVSGLIGVIFLLVGGYFLIGGYVVAVDPGLWEHGFIVILTSIQVWLKFVAYLCGSVGIAGVAIIFYFHAWDGGFKHITEKTKDSALLIGSSLAIVFVPLYVIFTGLHLKFIPRGSFTLDIILYSALAIIVLFFALHMVYYAMAHKNMVASHLGFVLIILAFLLVVLADNSTRENSLRKHTYQLIKSSANHASANSSKN